MTPIILATVNHYDLSKEDLTDLRDQMLAELPHHGVEIEVSAGEIHGTGNGLMDTLLIVLPSIDILKEIAYSHLVDVAIEFMKKRFGRQHESHRPRRILISAESSASDSICIVLENVSETSIEIRITRDDRPSSA